MTRAGTTLMRWLYTALLYLALPLALLNLLRRGLRQGAYLQRWGERFGWTPRATAGGVWVHCVSVGEFQAAIPLIRALLVQHGDRGVVVTCTTPTGSERIRAVFGEQVVHSYLPFDTPTATARFFARTRPAVGVIIECELWPNLYAAAFRRGVRLVMVNARVSARSAQAYQRLRSVSRVMLARVSAVLAQGPEDAERFLAIGARPDRVQVAGNLKYDIQLPDDLAARTRALHDALRWPADAPVLVGGSVHPPEWPVLLAAFDALRQQWPAARLVLVPRHPERFDRCAREAEAFAADRGWRVGRRSADPSGCDILVGDSMGELLAYYRLGTVSFVGGTLVPEIGGHNTLEPAALGRPVLFGPHRKTFADAGQALMAAGAGQDVRDTDTLAAATAAWWSDPAAANYAGQQGQAVIERSRGALAVALAEINDCVARHRQGVPLGDVWDQPPA